MTFHEKSEENYLCADTIIEGNRDLGNNGGGITVNVDAAHAKIFFNLQDQEKYCSTCTKQSLCTQEHRKAIRDVFEPKKKEEAGIKSR